MRWSHAAAVFAAAAGLSLLASVAVGAQQFAASGVRVEVCLVVVTPTPTPGPPAFPFGPADRPTEEPTQP